MSKADRLGNRNRRPGPSAFFYRVAYFYGSSQEVDTPFIGNSGDLATFPDEVKFMQETVTPSMGKLLGIESFSCAGCHPTEAPKKKARTTKRKPSNPNG